MAEFVEALSQRFHSRERWESPAGSGAGRAAAGLSRSGGLAHPAGAFAAGSDSACVRAIAAGTTTPYELIVVDDTATAATKEVIARIGGAIVTVNDQNLGYTRSLNRGAALARRPVPRVPQRRHGARARLARGDARLRPFVR